MFDTIVWVIRGVWIDNAGFVCNGYISGKYRLTDYHAPNYHAPDYHAPKRHAPLHPATAHLSRQRISIYRRICTYASYAPNFLKSKALYFSSFFPFFSNLIGSVFFYHAPDYHAPDCHAPDYHAPNYHAPDYHAPDYHAPWFRFRCPPAWVHDNSWKINWKYKITKSSHMQMIARF